MQTTNIATGEETREVYRTLFNKITYLAPTAHSILSFAITNPSNLTLTAEQKTNLEKLTFWEGVCSYAVIEFPENGGIHIVSRKPYTPVGAQSFPSTLDALKQAQKFCDDMETVVNSLQEQVDLQRQLLEKENPSVDLKPASGGLAAAIVFSFLGILTIPLALRLLWVLSSNKNTLGTGITIADTIIADKEKNKSFDVNGGRMNAYRLTAQMKFFGCFGNRKEQESKLLGKRNEKGSNQFESSNFEETVAMESDKRCYRF